MVKAGFELRLWGVIVHCAKAQLSGGGCRHQGLVGVYVLEWHGDGSVGLQY